MLISYGLYIQWKPIYALILLWVTAITYGGALLIEKRKAFGNRKYVIASFAILALLPLLVFKYYNFINDSMIALLNSIGWQTGLPGLNWAVPLGISFFTFQAVGYLFDVYYQRIEAERNWWDYMLFVSFFPQIASGPISKAKDLLPQIKANRTFDYDMAVQGCKWLLWGMFLKVVFADRLGMFVDKMYADYTYQNGTTCLFTAVMYSLQIYGDFAGYSLMAIGVGRLVGFDLINNFKRPYFAATITEFWKRWHISLTKWLTDYVYIPLGGSRCSKIRTYMNIMVTFFVSGIWHGANWTFVVWGMLHGVLQVAEKALGIQKCETKNFLVRFCRIGVTFMLVTIAWVFFRMPTLADGWWVISHMFTGGTLNIGFVGKTWAFFAVLAITTVIVKEIIEEYFPSITLYNNEHKIVRWAGYLATLVAILLCGVLDAGQFIYVSF